MTAPDPAAHRSLERRLDTVLGPDDAGTLMVVLSSLATRDDVAAVKRDVADVKREVADVKRDVADVKFDVGLITLDLADFKKEVAHEFGDMRKEFALVRTEMAAARFETMQGFHQETTRLLRWFVPTMFTGLAALGAVGAWLG